MKYDLIFYISKKTSYCSRMIKRYLKPIDFEENRVLSCTAPTTLGDMLCKSLTLCPLCIVVGGLSVNSDENTETVISRAMSSAQMSLQNVRKLQSENGQTGYILQYKKQIVLLFPDSPDDIESMLDTSLTEYIKKSFE